MRLFKHALIRKEVIEITTDALIFHFFRFNNMRHQRHTQRSTELNGLVVFANSLTLIDGQSLQPITYQIASGIRLKNLDSKVGSAFFSTV